MLSRRDSFNLIASHINPKEHSREFAILAKQISEYYQRDPSAQSVHKELFLPLLEQSFTNKKHLASFAVLLDEAYAIETSAANTDEIILNFKRNDIGNRLAVALANKDKTEADKLVEEYQELSRIESLDQLNATGTEIMDGDSWDEITNKELGRESALRLFPRVLSEHLGHRASGGHHIVTFARPEMGKTALNLTIGCGFARQGSPGIYFGNEDRMADVYMRAVSNLTGLDESGIRADLERAKELAFQRGLGNIKFVSLSPGNPQQVEAFVEKFKPGWFVMDQLRNLNVKEANKVLQLEYATTAMRTIAKKYNCIGVSTTQAGDSAEGKAVLDMGDVDFSNTGVAAQADVLLGMGASVDQYKRNQRTIHLSKNKITGDHATFTVEIQPQLSRIRSIGDA